MVIDLVDSHGARGASFALDFVENDAKSKPWVFIEPYSTKACLYPPSFSAELRDAMANKKIFWIRCRDELCPKVALHWLNSSLCQGVVLHRFEGFTKAVPPAVWGRRWQLACKKTQTHFVWVHSQELAVIGFDLRLSWSPQSSEPIIKKGQHLFEKLKRPAA